MISRVLEAPQPTWHTASAWVTPYNANANATTIRTLIQVIAFERSYIAEDLVKEQALVGVITHRLVM